MSAKGQQLRHVLALALLALTCSSGQSGIVTQGVPREVQRALAAELSAAQDKSHPMCYELRRSSPRATSTKKICETRDGAIALLVALNDRHLTSTETDREQARLNALLQDPKRQIHRKDSDDADMARVLKILRALPYAFLYRPAGMEAGPDGPLERFSFVPNPSFDPPSLETLPMTKMSGDLWIDPAHGRITRLEGHLHDDVNFGWGILGQLDKGGWIRVEQAEVTGGQWRITHFQLEMTGRIIVKSRVFSSDQRLTGFIPVPADLGYQQAIHMLLTGSSDAHAQNH